MEQDNERDYLGRPYTAGSYETEPPGQYGPTPLMPESGGALPCSPSPAGPAPTDAENDGDGSGTDTASGLAPGRGMRVGTVVWGLVLTVLAVLLLLVDTVNLRVDPVLLLLCLTLGAGLALLAGGFLAAFQRSRSR
ncbi:hypothetical protein [Arthrobacter sp. zg-Y1143]|uniref:hypothetical protein n=1 Tax=Arthrobacter sp. zg-Y1143 TaxID=3049065 RepID=UPI0024C2A726|nr:hypothetical protein [Arthrobacter sp. zg-Y1143]MDK1326935.1 hypothetical protein [Arthrobacter sp. zg-Y1143]